MTIPTPIVYHNAGLGDNGGLNDLTAGGRDLTAFNGAEIIADTDSGGTQAFNMLPTIPQVDSHFRDSTLADFDNAANFSVSCWIKHDGSTGKQIIVANHAINKGNIQVYRDGSEVYFRNGFLDPLSGSGGDGEDLRTTGTAVPNSDQWYNIVFTYDGSVPLPSNNSTTQTRILCYVDGVLASTIYSIIGSYTGSAIVVSNAVGPRSEYAIGAIQERTVGGTPTGLIRYPFQGRIDSVRMWDETLESSVVGELSASRNAGSGGGSHINSLLLGVG